MQSISRCCWSAVAIVVIATCGCSSNPSQVALTARPGPDASLNNETDAANVEPQQVDESLNMPEDPRVARNRRKFLEATQGLRFEADRVIVVESLSDGDTAETLVETAHQRWEANDMYGSMSAATKAVRREPENAVGYSLLGRALMHKGRPDEAIAAHRTAVALEPDATTETGRIVRFEMAIALAMNNRFAEAIQLMTDVTAQDATNAVAHERLAIWQYYERDYNAAWSQVAAAEALGHAMPAQFLSLLEQAMPRPR